MADRTLYDVNSIAGGYFYECSCGERYSVVENAISCRKCRVYTEERRCTTVYDIEKQELLWECPSVKAEAERRAAREAYEAEAKRPFTLGDHCPSLGAVVV